MEVRAMADPFTGDPEQTGSAAPQQPPLPVIDPGLLIAALEAAGWVKTGELDDGHVVMAPHGTVVIPLDKGDPFYAKEMATVIRRLEYEFL
jgi:hypothetical protein